MQWIFADFVCAPYINYKATRRFFLFLQITFQLIATLVSLVPLVDCTDALRIRNDLTEVRFQIL